MSEATSNIVAHCESDNFDADEYIAECDRLGFSETVHVHNGSIKATHRRLDGDTDNMPRCPDAQRFTVAERLVEMGRYFET